MIHDISRAIMSFAIVCCLYFLNTWVEGYYHLQRDLELSPQATINKCLAAGGKPKECGL